jgi:hypothetical protein
LREGLGGNAGAKTFQNGLGLFVTDSVEQDGELFAAIAEQAVILAKNCCMRCASISNTSSPIMWP